MDVWEVDFQPCDLLNPEFGYRIKVRHNGSIVLLTAQHPVTGDDLDYAGCLEVAAMYGPKNHNRRSVGR